VRFLDCATKHAELRAANSAALARLIREVRIAAEAAAPRPDVHGRVKGVWSTWLKVLTTGAGIEGVEDLIGIRVLADTVTDCYRVVHELQRRWSTVGAVEDYIESPKRNGYQSLHAVLRDASGRRFEVQVRTRGMHRVCETGRADHQLYKRAQMGRAAVSIPPLPPPDEPSWLRAGGSGTASPDGDVTSPADASWTRWMCLRPTMARDWSILSVVMVAVVGSLDYVTGHAVGFAIFYLLPISMATWWVGRRVGTAVAVVSTMVWWAVDGATAPLPVDMAVSAWNAGMRLGIFVLLVRSQAALHDALRREEAMSRTDHLTGAANGRAFLDVARNELCRARRYGRPLTVAFTHLDDLARARRRLGRVATNELLREWSRVLRELTRSCDHLARLREDEFSLLLPEVTPAQAREALSRLSRELEAAGNQLGWPITFSIGAVTFDAAPESVESMLRETDVLMCSARVAGRTRWLHEVRERSSGRRDA